MMNKQEPNYVENKKQIEEKTEKTNNRTNEKREDMIRDNNSETPEDEILEKYDIFASVYSFSDDFEYIDSEDSDSSGNSDPSEKTNILSLIVQNIVNIYPNNEKNREFKKYKDKKLEEKKQKQQQEEAEKKQKKQKIYEEKRKHRLEVYRVQKGKKKLIEKKKYMLSHIEHEYLMIKKHFEFLKNTGRATNIRFSFQNYLISPMRIYFVMNINVDRIHYLDISRKWLPDKYTPLIIELCIQKKVKCLNLSFNKLTYDSVPLLSEYLRDNKYLFRIDLEGNNLTNSGENSDDANMLFRSLEHNYALRCINLANTNLNKSNGEALCRLLSRNTVIIEINMEENNFTIEQYRTIIKRISRNQKIKRKNDELVMKEQKRMSREENYMHMYIMALEASIIDVENSERRKRLDKQKYINSWKEELRKKEQQKIEIAENLEKEHQTRIRDLEKKKLKKKKKK